MRVTFRNGVKGTVRLHALVGAMLAGLSFSWALVSCRSAAEADGYQSLIEPDHITIIRMEEDQAEEALRLYPDDESYEEIYREVNQSWTESLDPDSHEPARVRVSHMRPDYIDQISVEIQFEYDEPVSWKQGGFQIDSYCYSFFPLDEGLPVAAISENGDYAYSAVVVEFLPSEDLKELTSACIE